MTWSPLRTEVTPGPTSTTMPAPSWPRIAGKSPSGSAPERVYSSVWQMPVAFTSTSTSKARGPSSWTVSTDSGWPASHAIAARTSISALRERVGDVGRVGLGHLRVDRVRQVALAEVGNDRDDRLSAVLGAPGQLQRRPGDRAARDAAEDP